MSNSPLLASFLCSLILLPANGAWAQPAKVTQSPARTNSQGTIVRCHFIGSEKLARHPDAGQLKDLWALPSAAAFRNDLLLKLATASSRLLDNSGTNISLAPNLRPLIDRLFEAESSMEIRKNEGGVLEMALVIEGKANSTAVWETNLLTLAKKLGWGPGKELPRQGGWIFQRQAQGAQWIRFLKTNDWVAIDLNARGSGWRSEALLTELENARKSTAGAGSRWIETQLDLKRLSEWFRLPGTNLPTIQLAIYGKGDHVRSEGTLSWAAPQGWQLGRWTIPTNTVRDPLISFSALQGARDLLGAVGRKLGMPPPNQAFAWAFSQIPYQSYVAIPVPDSPRALDQIARNFPTLISTNYRAVARGGAKRVKPLEVAWLGLPVFVPFVRATTEPAGNFLVAGVFPPPPTTNPAPAELFNQILGRKDLLYYAWEITSERLPHWTKLGLTTSLIVPDLNFRTDSPGQKWLDEIAPRLARETSEGRQGDAVTELKVISPSELHLTRRSQVGFTALELVTLRYLLDHPDFPFLRSGRGGIENAAPRPARPPPVKR